MVMLGAVSRYGDSVDGQPFAIIIAIDHLKVHTTSKLAVECMSIDCVHRRYRFVHMVCITSDFVGMEQRADSLAHHIQLNTHYIVLEYLLVASK